MLKYLSILFTLRLAFGKETKTHIGHKAWSQKHFKDDICSYAENEVGEQRDRVMK